MFTGIALGFGEITEIEIAQSTKRIGVQHHGILVPPLKIGNSVLVSGVCLSIIKLENQSVWFDLIPETLSLTIFDKLQIGDRVNLEKPLAFGDELGGHVIQGHVEATGTICEKIDVVGDFRLRIVIADLTICPYVVHKGYIAVDGISLTVTKWDPDTHVFEVALIPDTLSKTTLGIKAVGDTVNLETDIGNRLIMKSAHTYFANLDERVRRLENKS